MIGIFLRRQHAADLFVPLLAGARAPVVRGEDEAALLEILAQPHHFLVREARGAAVFDEDVRTLEEVGIGWADRDVVRVAGLVLRDARSRQLAETHAEVDVGAGIVSAPAALLTMIAREHQPAVVERAGERRRRRMFRGCVEAESAAPDLRMRHTRGNRYCCNRAQSHREASASAHASTGLPAYSSTRSRFVVPALMMTVRFRCESRFL